MTRDSGGGTGNATLAEREAAVAAREGELQAEWERLRYVLLAARMATWEYDIQDDRAVLSPSAAAYFGVAEGAAPCTFAELLACVHPDDRRHVSEAFARALTPEASDGPEFRVVWPDGSVHWIANKGRVWRDERGVPRKMLGLVYGIDERKRDEERRLEFERRVQHHQKLESLGVLAGGIAHDFNNLLVGVLGNASMLALDIPVDSPLREPVESIEKAAKRAAELVRQMLAYTGRAHLVPQSVDLNALVLEMEALLRAAISRRIAFRFEIQPDLPAVTADASQLRQVVMNLITNAADAIGDDNGVITVRTSRLTLAPSAAGEEWASGEMLPGEYCCVEVTDTGVGMDAATQARIFDPFFTTKFVGRGLGLAATVGIVRSHGGGISVTSEPGAGARFVVAIPQGSGRAAPEPNPPTDPLRSGWRGHGTALVIDDESAVRQVVGPLLRRAGFDVLLAADALSGAELLRRHTSDVVVALIDRSMPGLAGPAAVDRLAAIAPALPIVLMTGDNSVDAVTEYRGRRLAGVLRKPFLASDLLTIVRTAIRG